MARRRSLGFTLLELVTAMTIMAMLATVGIVGYRSSVKRSKEGVLKENLFQMNHALEQHKADRGKYPPDISELVKLGYLRSIPDDPMTGSIDTWTFEMESPDPDEPDAELGVWRVRSGSDDVGDNGIPYNEW